MQKKNTNNTYNVHKTGALLQTTEGQYEDLSLVYKLLLFLLNFNYHEEVNNTTHT